MPTGFIHDARGLPQGLRGDRALAAGLVLAIHAAFLLLLWIERMAPRRTVAATQQLLSIGIRLMPLSAEEEGTEAPPAPASGQDGGSSAPGAAPSMARAIPITQDEGDGTQDESSPATEAGDPVDWHAGAAEQAARYAERIDRPDTLRPATNPIRQPCRPRRDFDADTRQKMNALLPPKPDLDITGAEPPTKSVMMGNTRVGLLGVGGVRPPPEDDGRPKSSFRWKWDEVNRGGIGSLTLGWEEPPPYDGMFDDMKAGRTPDSSVPDPNTCD